jgi:very-short-patch-repair endonuclease
VTIAVVVALVGVLVRQIATDRPRQKAATRQEYIRDTGEVGPPFTPHELRQAIADTLADYVKAYDLAKLCEAYGLEPEGDDENPYSSKRGYVNRRLLGKDLPDLVEIARRVVEEFGAPDLASLIDQLVARGVAGEMKNLIFAANGPKPRLVLRDAINNVIEITDNAKFCLVYDEPLPESGLTWKMLVRWWSRLSSEADERKAASALYKRLTESLASEGERLVFRVYGWLYRTLGFDIPALIPQVYLHFDPYIRRQLAESAGPLPRQRMDFLLLLPGRERVVIEVDGKQHYSGGGDRADPSRYADMVREDRGLRLSGYEVYRFGGAELNPAERGEAVTNTFFEMLLRRHGALKEQ